MSGSGAIPLILARKDQMMEGKYTHFPLYNKFYSKKYKLSYFMMMIYSNFKGLCHSRAI